MGLKGCTSASVLRDTANVYHARPSLPPGSHTMESSDDNNLTDTEHSVAAMNKRKTFQSQRTLLVTKQFLQLIKTFKVEVS